MKNSRKIFLSACVATMVASSAYAAGTPFNDTSIKDEKNNGNYSFSSQTAGIYEIGDYLGTTFDGKRSKHINHLNIDAAKSTFNIDGTGNGAGIGAYDLIEGTEAKGHFYSFNIKAKELNFNNGASLDVGKASTIEGNLNLNTFAELSIYNGYNYRYDTTGIRDYTIKDNTSGSLLVKGNLNASDTTFKFYGNHGFHVEGDVMIRNSIFNAYNAPVGENGIFLLSTSGKFNKDIMRNNTAGVYMLMPTVELLGLNAEEAKKYKETLDEIEVNIKGVDHELKVVGNSLYISANVDTKTWANDIKTNGVAKSLKEAQKLALESLIAQYETIKNGTPGKDPRANEQQELSKADYDLIIKDLTNKMNAIDVNSKAPAFNAQVDAVLASILTSNRQQAAASALADAMLGNAEQARNVVDSARESANNSNRQGAIQVINLANEMAISTRMMQPRSQGENSVWSNAFGGANMVGSENDSVFGITLGIDRQFSDSILFGAYLTYADSKLSHKSINQDADNLQFGAYSRIANNNHEFDIKAYAQFSYADQERFLNGSTQKSDYTQTYLGASGVYGYVFDMGNDFAIKPLVGLNLYYSNTPDYTESGVWAQHVQSMSSFAASAELGAEFRKAFGNGFFYITPKVEQFFATSGDDFTARFTGSDINYNVAGAEKDKTFGKLIAGSNFNITDNLSLDVSVGVKQILANKDDDTDETYLSGNIGVKYSF